MVLAVPWCVGFSINTSELKRTPGLVDCINCTRTADASLSTTTSRGQPTGGPL